MKSSPLLVAILVLAVFVGLAIPLERLTRDGPPGCEDPARINASGSLSTGGAGSISPVEGVACWLSLRLVDAADEVVVTMPDGSPLWRVGAPGEGVTEAEVRLPSAGHGIDLLLKVKWPSGVGESAAALTIEPEGLPGATRWAAGGPHLEEMLVFDWGGENAP